MTKEKWCKKHEVAYGRCCKACIAEYNKYYYKNNRERLIANKVLLRKEHPEITKKENSRRKVPIHLYAVYFDEFGLLKTGLSSYDAPSTIATAKKNFMRKHNFDSVSIDGTMIWKKENADEINESFLQVCLSFIFECPFVNGTRHSEWVSVRGIPVTDICHMLGCIQTYYGEWKKKMTEQLFEWRHLSAA